MTSFSSILTATAPVFIIVLLGFLFRHLRWLTTEAEKSLMTLLINLFIPCFIFNYIVGNKAVENLGNVLMAPIVGFVTVCIGFGMGYLLAPLFDLKSKAEKASYSFSCGIYNYGFLPLPIIIHLFDSETTGVLVLNNIGVEAALWTIGVMILSGSSISENLKKIINPPSVAILVSLLINYCGLSEYFEPQATGATRVLAEVIAILAKCLIPIGILLSGAGLYAAVDKSLWKNSWKIFSGAILVHFCLAPLIFLTIGHFIPCSFELKRVIVVLASMPAGVFQVVFVSHYKSHTPTAAKVVIATSIASIILTPLWIIIGSKFLLST